jgi:hypothetical protein
LANRLAHLKALLDEDETGSGEDKKRSNTDSKRSTTLTYLQNLPQRGETTNFDFVERKATEFYQSYTPEKARWNSKVCLLVLSFTISHDLFVVLSFLSFRLSTFALRKSKRFSDLVSKP